MSKPWSLVFDLDDTLYLECDYVRSGFNAVGTWLSATTGLDQFSPTAWRLFKQGHRDGTFDLALRESGYRYDRSLILQMVEVYRTHSPQISLLPDALQCLEHFRGEVPLAIISDGSLVAQQRKYDALGLGRLIPSVIYTDAWGREFWKPHKRAFEAVQSSSMAPYQHVYVADNPNKDFEAPAALGWLTVRIRHPEGLHATTESKPDSPPDFDITSLSQLIDLFPCHREKSA